MPTRRFANQIERAAFAVAALTDQTKLATLRSDRAANGRLCQCLYWMRVAAGEGADLRSFLEQALASYAAAPAHGRLVREGLLRNYDTALGLGCLSAENLGRLRHRRAPIIERSRFVGQKAEVDHVVPIRHARALRHDFANLRLAAQSANRQKSDRIGAKQLAHAQRLQVAGLLTMGELTALQGAAAGGAEFPAAKPWGGGTSPSVTGFAAHGASGGYGSGLVGTDPRVIFPRVGILLERLEDWESRSQHAVESGGYAGRQVAELANRAESRARLLLAQVEEDLALAARLTEQVAAAGQRCQEAMDQAQMAVKNARQAQAAAERAVAHWAHEVAAAKQWLAQARAREQHAHQVYEQTRRALEQAQSRLRDAQAELDAARHRTEPAGRDREGNTIYKSVDTRPYEEAVRRAEQKIARCWEMFHAAEMELHHAIANREAAERRVHACESALGLASRSRDHAGLAGQAAIQAHATADRAREEHARAGFTGREVDRHAQAKAEAAEAVRAHAMAAQAHCSAAEAALGEAGTLHGDARNHSTQGRMEIAWRLDQLRAFDALPAGI